MRKRVPSEFGIIVPQETGVKWVKQGGGMSCIQRTLEGVYIPLGEQTYNLGHPEWTPTGSNFEEKLNDLSFEGINEEDYERLPPHIQERGSFRDADEFFNWMNETEVYGWIELWDDLYRFTYGFFERLESDPRVRWEDVNELWETLDEQLPFTYEEVEYDREVLQDEVEFDVENYPRPEPAIHWIRITSSNTEWATELEGQIVFFLCPNAD